MTRQITKSQSPFKRGLRKKILIPAFLLAALLSEGRVQPAFCFSQAHFSPSSPSLKNHFSVRPPSLRPYRKHSRPTAKISSMDVWLGVSEAFARAA